MSDCAVCGEPVETYQYVRVKADPEDGVGAAQVFAGLEHSAAEIQQKAEEAGLSGMTVVLWHNPPDEYVEEYAAPTQRGLEPRELRSVPDREMAKRLIDLGANAVVVGQGLQRVRTPVDQIAAAIEQLGWPVG